MDEVVGRLRSFQNKFIMKRFICESNNTIVQNKEVGGYLHKEI